MNAAFFGLAVLAALNPKLFAVDLLLIENARPRLMFACFLLGGMGVSLAIGLLDVFVLQADAVKTQGSVSASLDLALGVPLLAIGILVWTGRLHGRRRAPAAPVGGQPPKKEGWAQRVLREPRFGLAVLLGAVAGTPGAAYVTALRQLITGNSSTAAQAFAVVVFVIIEFSLVIIPFVFLEFRPEGTKARLQHTQAWLMGHARQLMAFVAVFVGAYMVISGLVRLLT
jgi:Sap, sulfolipid-1-addressing protein